MCEQRGDECVGRMKVIHPRSVRLAAIFLERQAQNRSTQRIEDVVVDDWISPGLLRQQSLAMAVMVVV